MPEEEDDEADGARWRWVSPGRALGRLGSLQEGEIMGRERKAERKALNSLLGRWRFFWVGWRRGGVGIGLAAALEVTTAEEGDVGGGVEGGVRIGDWMVGK